MLLMAEQMCVMEQNNTFFSKLEVWFSLKKNVG